MTPKILAVVPNSEKTNRRIEEKNGSNKKKKKQIVVMMKKSPAQHIKDDPTKQIKKYEAEAVSHPLAKMFSLKVTGIRRNDHDQADNGKEDKKQDKNGFRASPKDPLFNNRL